MTTLVPASAEPNRHQGTTRRRSARRLRILAALVLALVGAVGSVAAASPATAASTVLGPGGFRCGYHQIQISPPRVYATRGTEQVVWANALERWNGWQWVAAGYFVNFSSFNYYGQQVTAWSGVPSIAPYGSFINSELIVSAPTPGYYRVAANVSSNGGGPVYNAYIQNGAYCWVS